jgi:KAP family P-loop domain
MQDVADHFGWLVAKVGRPVVFFIDDLDRCTESYVVELLDAVQTLVRDAPKRLRRKDGRTAGATYFVVAADGAWIRNSYEIAYDKFMQSVAEPGRPLGYLFLDKLFQLRVPVPSVDGHRQDGYLRELLRGKDPAPSMTYDKAEEQEVRDRLAQSVTGAEVVETLRQASPAVRDLVAGKAVERLTAPEVAAATEHSLQRFRPLLQSNPRSMKRFVNAYGARRDVRVLEGNLVSEDPLALWTIIETRWPSLADYLCANPDAIELLGGRPSQLDGVPADLQSLFSDLAVRRLAAFGHGGPLTPSLIRACCGAAESFEASPRRQI